MRETTHWTYEFGVRRQDGAYITAQEPSAWTAAEAARYAAVLDDAANRIGDPRRATVVRRKKTTTVRNTWTRWEEAS